MAVVARKDFNFNVLLVGPNYCGRHVHKDGEIGLCWVTIIKQTKNIKLCFV